MLVTDKVPITLNVKLSKHHLPAAVLFRLLPTDHYAKLTIYIFETCLSIPCCCLNVLRLSGRIKYKSDQCTDQSKIRLTTNPHAVTWPVSVSILWKLY